MADIKIDVKSLNLSVGTTVTKTYQLAVKEPFSSIYFNNMKYLEQYEIEVTIPQKDRNYIFISSIAICSLCNGKDYSKKTSNSYNRKIHVSMFDNNTTCWSSHLVFVPIYKNTNEKEKEYCDVEVKITMLDQKKLKDKNRLLHIKNIFTGLGEMLRYDNEKNIMYKV